MFSRASEYAIKAMIWLAQKEENSSELSSLGDIAEAIDSPRPFTAKLLQQLARENFLHSTKGPRGGFRLNRPAEEINLRDIVLCFDGEKLFTGCAMGIKACTAEKPCPLHFQFAKVRHELEEMLHHASLKNMAHELNDGLAVLKR